MIKKIMCWALSLLLVAAPLSGCTEQEQKGTAALVPNPIAQNNVVPNPYMASNESIVHNDAYSSDVSGGVVPLGIYPEITTAYETESVNAPPSIFFDDDSSAITPYLGGVAIRDLTQETIQTLGCFVPSRDDGQQYSVQISYSFVDQLGNIVVPTTHGHVMMLKTKDENGQILPRFEKVLDVDVLTPALEQLGEGIDRNLLSIVFDYQGNLWFVTGGFRIYPDRSGPGFLGYLSRAYIDAVLNGQSPDVSEALHFLKLGKGEGAENGISSNPTGTAVLTNQACYMFRASESGVETLWRTPYGSNGANDAKEGSEITGGGLAWGSGTTPTLTNDLVCFTDNLDPVNLIALSAETGEVAAQIPVLDDLPEGSQVAVENSILVYSGDADRTSIVVCNWFGAGSPGLSKPEADSSIQKFSNIYSEDWTNQGNKMLMPGAERVDIVKTQDGYTARKIWERKDLRDTSMIKLSTATGYLYGYVQNLETEMWCYQMFDFDTGETVLEVPVSNRPEYNNMAVGMVIDARGNALYCPTNNLELLRLQDRFVYLPDSPYAKVDLDLTGRKQLGTEEFRALTGTQLSPVGYLSSAVLKETKETTVAFRMNGLSGRLSSLSLFGLDSGGNLVQIDSSLWTLRDSMGKELSPNASLSESTLYEVWVQINDQSEFDLDAGEKQVELAVILGAGE